ncbi:hypothetical protein Z945_1417 [Sulfitobacter noctilucae]|nr:hypothetical protein Z945_1417 [Sulfitobacter noctilucae]
MAAGQTRERSDWGTEVYPATFDQDGCFFEEAGRQNIRLPSWIRSHIA